MESSAVFENLVEDIGAERLDVVAQFFQSAEAALLALAWQPDTADLETAELRFLLEYWHRLRGDRSLPAASEVTPFDMRPALGYVTIVEALDEGRDGQFRLFGSKVALRLGADLTGKRLGALDGSSYLAVFACALHRAVYLRREPVHAAHQPPAAISGTAWHWLVLPLCGTGPAVERYLVGMVPMAARPRG